MLDFRYILYLFYFEIITIFLNTISLKKKVVINEKTVEREQNKSKYKTPLSMKSGFCSDVINAHLSVYFKIV